MEHISEKKPKADVRKIEDQLNQMSKDISGIAKDEINKTPPVETESQYKIPQAIINETNNYIKPVRLIASREPFNEKFRDSYEFDKKYVLIIAENNECKGDSIDIWCKPYPGCPATEWIVPVGKPVYVPRFVAEQIKRKSYRRLKMGMDNQSKAYGSDQNASYYGSIAVESTIQRLDCRPHTQRKSLFFSEEDFKEYKPSPKEIING